MTLTSDCNEEFFDALSDFGCSPPDDFHSDDDDDDGDDYVPSVCADHEPSINDEPSPDEQTKNLAVNHLTQPPPRNMKRATSGDKLLSLNRKSMTRSCSDNNIVVNSGRRTLLDCDNLHKSKSASSEMEQNTFNRKEMADNEAACGPKCRWGCATRPQSCLRHRAHNPTRALLP